MTEKISEIPKIKSRCAMCSGPFGLIRHRFANKQCCSKHCRDRYLVERKQKSSLTENRTKTNLPNMHFGALAPSDGFGRLVGPSGDLPGR
jgi:hypothetical protein